MIDNKSMAVWCAARPDMNESGFEAHFNYWRVSGDEDFRPRDGSEAKDFVEIGIMIEEPQSVQKICLYLPFRINYHAIEDCSDYFYKASISQGIFNEVLDVTSPAAPAFRYVQLNAVQGPFCRVHKFMVANGQIDPIELSLATIADGTLLTIEREALREIERHGLPLPKAYFRLRLSLDKNARAVFVRALKTPERLFQSGVDEIEYIDFRLNEARTLPPQVEGIMRDDRANSVIKLRLLAFLTAIPVQSELSASNDTTHKLRLLEHKLWNTYVPNGIPEGMTVYHWKKKYDGGSASDFSAFVKLQTRRSGRKTLRKYLCFAFAFGIIGNLAASVIQLSASAIWERLNPTSASSAIVSPSSPIESKR